MRAFKRAGRAELLASRSCRGSSPRSRSNIEVGEGGHKRAARRARAVRVLRVRRCRAGTSSRTKIQNVTVRQPSCYATPQDIQPAVHQFTHPDVRSSKAANAAALGTKLKPKTPAAVDGHRDRAERQRRRRRRGERLVPARAARLHTVRCRRTASAERAGADYFHTKIYYDPAQTSAKAAAVALAKLIAPADVAPLPPRRRPAARARPGLDARGRPRADVPQHDRAGRRAAAARARAAERARRRRAGRTRCSSRSSTRSRSRSRCRRCSSATRTPTRLRATRRCALYDDRRAKHKAVRLVFRTGGNEYWGIEETNWDDAPVLADRSFRHDLGGREFDLYYSGLAPAHGRAARRTARRYWVVNTLLDSLSNETMLAIAKGLKPLTARK